MHVIPAMDEDEMEDELVEGDADTDHQYISGGGNEIDGAQVQSGDSNGDSNGKVSPQMALAHAKAGSGNNLAGLAAAAAAANDLSNGDKLDGTTTTGKYSFSLCNY